MPNRIYFLENEETCLENEIRFHSFCIYPENPLQFCNQLIKNKSEKNLFKVLSGTWDFVPNCDVSRRIHIDENGNFIVFQSNCDLYYKKYEDVVLLSKKLIYGKLKFTGKKIKLQNVYYSSGKILNEDINTIDCNISGNGNILLVINNKMALYKEIDLPHVGFQTEIKFDVRDQ